MYINWKKFKKNGGGREISKCKIIFCVSLWQIRKSIHISVGGDGVTLYSLKLVIIVLTILLSKDDIQYKEIISQNTLTVKKLVWEAGMRMRYGYDVNTKHACVWRGSPARLLSAAASARAVELELWLWCERDTQVTGRVLATRRACPDTPSSILLNLLENAFTGHYKFIIHIHIDRN